MPRILAPCGTRAAYVRHQRRGEPVDDACQEANNEYCRTRYHKLGKHKPRTEAACGTISGFEKHRRRYEPPCEACRDAVRLYRAQRRATHAGRPVPTEPPPPRGNPACGTVAGYHAHLRRSEKPCQACADVKREYSRAWWAARKNTDRKSS